jgi:hypothetical protein
MMMLLLVLGSVEHAVRLVSSISAHADAGATVRPPGVWGTMLIAGGKDAHGGKVKGDISDAISEAGLHYSACSSRHFLWLVVVTMVFIGVIIYV